jgi:hypothetical protein
MMKSDRRAWWIAAGLSGLICGLVGPLIGFIVPFVAALPSYRSGDIASSFGGFLLFVGLMWLFAVKIFGLPGFILGCCGGLLLKWLAAKCRSEKGVIGVGAVLGLALGSAVNWPLVAIGVYDRTKVDSYTALQSFKGYTLLGALSGMVCGILMAWLLRSRGLIRLSYE